MPTIANGLTAMRTLRTQLQARLDADYVATFSTYGGADVVLEDDEPQESDQVGRPYGVIKLIDDKRSQWSDARGKTRDFTFRIEVKASDFSGAQVGVANLEGSDTKLTNTIIAILEADYTVLMNSGLEGIRHVANTEGITNTSAGEIHNNPITVTGWYHTA